MESDSLGNIYTIGNIYDSVNVALAANPKKMLYGTPGFTSVFISKYKANGDLIWGTALKSNSDVNASKKLRRDRLEVAQKVVNIKDYLEKTGIDLLD